MKYSIALCLILACSVPTLAAPPNDPLGRAIVRLSTKITPVDRSWVADARRAGWKAADIGINLAGLIALSRSATLIFNKAEALVISAGAGAAGLGSVIGLLGSITLWMRGKPKPRDPAYYRGKAGADEFFRMSPDDQYGVAARDEVLTKYLLDLDVAFTRVDEGFPERAAVGAL